MKDIFHSLCSDRISSAKANKTCSFSTPDSNPFEILSGLLIEDDSPSTTGADEMEADEAHHQKSNDETDDAEEDGIKDDEVVQDLELRFALWVRSAYAVL